jgi:acetoacetate decarboxylase
MISYPPPPWTLKGDAWQALQLVDIERVRSLIPPSVNIVSLFPGKTVGGIGIVRYGAGSTMEYNELVVVAALTYYQGQIGAWISHIYVDSPASVAGGREIWGLPKELAHFTWETENEQQKIAVHQEETLLCVLRAGPEFPLWRSPLILPNLRLRPSDQTLLFFQAQVTAHLKFASLDVVVPPESPFADLRIDQPLFGFGGRNFEMAIAAATPLDFPEN